MENTNSVLPVGFDGVFRFTNFTGNDFSARWDGVEYTFPKMSTTPMVIPNASPTEVQHIRKKFAKELAILEFYKSDKFQELNKHTPGGVPATYTDSDLAPFIQRCLEPLPVAQARVKVLPKDTEDRYRKDDKGRNVTKVLEGGESLMGEGTPMQG